MSSNDPPRTLGLDVGLRRIGVSLSDPLGWTAQPLETVQVHRDNRHMRRLKQLCDEHDVKHIVVGLPLNMDGTEGKMARRVRALAARLQRITEIEPAFWDERLTSAAAERVLKQAGLGHNKRTQVVDQLSACLILQSWMDANTTP